MKLHLAATGRCPLSLRAAGARVALSAHQRCCVTTRGAGHRPAEAAQVAGGVPGGGPLLYRQGTGVAPAKHSWAAFSLLQARDDKAFLKGFL